MFRRKRAPSDVAPPAPDAAPGPEEAPAADGRDGASGEDAPEAADGAVSDAPAPEAAAVPTGPFDVADAPADGISRVDLGPLRVPVAKGVELRLEVDAQGRPVAANLTTPQGAAQLTVFAAPRTEGIWDEVRAEIRSGLSASGGLSEERPGPFGTELYASVPAQAQNGTRVLTPARFWGVDGPRWFVRALVTGTAASDVAASRGLEQLLRHTVVSRDDEPRPVREPLPIVLPPELAEQAAARAAELRERQSATADQAQTQQRAQQEAAQREISRRARESAATGGQAAVTAQPAASEQLAAPEQPPTEGAPSPRHSSDGVDTPG